MAKKVAIIETKPSRTNYAQEFDRMFEFDQFQLCSDSSVKKVLKKDCDINIDVSQYDFVILVGSEPCKFYTKVSSVTEFSGKLVDGKFLPIINPSMLSFKPEMRKAWEASVASIIDYIVNDKEDFDVSESKVRGIRDSQELHSFLRDALSHPGSVIALDSETTALYPRDGYMLGLSICYDPQVGGAYIDSECVDEEAEELLQELFNTKIVVFHNAKFDLAFFQYHFGFKFPKFEDTMLMHYILDENPGNHGLKQLAVKYTKYGDYEQPMYQWIDDYCKKNKVLKSMFQWEWIPFDVMIPYASIDAIVTLELYELFKVFKKNPKMLWVYENLLLEGTKFLVDIQDNGVPFSIDRLRHSQEVMQRDIDEAVKQLYMFKEIKQFEQVQGKEFNPNSVMQLRSLLFDYIGLEPTGKKTGTGANSTDAEVLNELADQHPVPAHILEIRKKSKIKNTYLDKIIPQLDADGRLRTNFNLHGTTSGRLSSSGKLNMQQLPRDNPAVKGSIMAREGYSIVALDLTTAEVYVAAILSGDKSLQSVFTSGGNFHSTIAHKVFKLPCSVEQVVELYPLQRQMAKAVTFGINKMVLL
jgi:DNA polymerase I-like protein with 3'-5' exonuclease and polymerase domains